MLRPLTIKIVTQFNLSIYKGVTISLACQPEFIEGCTGAAFNMSHTFDMLKPAGFGCCRAVSQCGSTMHAHNSLRTVAPKYF
ncbi:MAG: hypothetical protein P8Z35_24565, partial [Ignavibacteriaceae bacterium]